MTVARPRTLVSEAEFLARAPSMTRVELVDGEVIVSPSPTVWHQTLLVRVVHALLAWAEDRPGPVFVGQSPLDVRFAPGRILQPDAFVVLGEVALDQEGPLEQIPALCVEVLSQDRVYDRVTKRGLYAAAGVREFWVVEPSGLVERWSGSRLDQSEEHTEALVTALLPGFRLDLTRLFHR